MMIVPIPQAAATLRNFPWIEATSTTAAIRAPESRMMCSISRSV
jgi:hypothetical protein